MLIVINLQFSIEYSITGPSTFQAINTILVVTNPVTSMFEFYSLTCWYGYYTHVYLHNGMKYARCIRNADFGQIQKYIYYIRINIHLLQSVTKLRRSHQIKNTSNETHVKNAVFFNVGGAFNIIFTINLILKRTVQTYVFLLYKKYLLSMMTNNIFRNVNLHSLCVRTTMDIQFH